MARGARQHGTHPRHWRTGGVMAEEQPDVQAAMLEELEIIHRRLDAIRSWVAFGGVVLLLAIALAACNAFLSL